MNCKELTELIHQNTRIILPEFGAFLVKDSGEKGFIPANVSFSPFLRYNDGMLEVYVAKKRGVSKEEAAKDVQEFVETIKNELLENGIFEIDGLGYLKRDQRGSLSFSLSQPDEKNVQDEKALSEKTKVKKETPAESNQPVDNRDVKEDAWLAEKKPIDYDDHNVKKGRKVAGSKTKVEKLTPSKKIDNSKQKPIQDNLTEPTIEIESARRVVESPPDQTIADELKKQPIGLEPKEEPIQIDAKNPPIKGLEKTSIPAVEPNKRKSFAGLLYTAIAIVLIAILFFIIKDYYLPPNFEPTDDSLMTTTKPESIINDKVEANAKVDKPKDDIDKAFNELSNDKKATKEQLKKEKEQEEAIADNLIKETQIKSGESKSTSGVKYYIIAGSFKNPDFANKFMNELKKSGYNASIVVQPSGMNAVNIGSYSTREEANKAKMQFITKLPNLWILKK